MYSICVCHQHTAPSQHSGVGVGLMHGSKERNNSLIACGHYSLIVFTTCGHYRMHARKGVQVVTAVFWCCPCGRLSVVSQSDKSQCGVYAQANVRTAWQLLRALPSAGTARRQPHHTNPICRVCRSNACCVLAWRWFLRLLKA